MKIIDDILGFIVVLLFYYCIGSSILDLISEKAFHKEIEFITVVWVLISIPLLLAGIVYIYNYFQERQKLNVKCPHGIPGGKVQNLCPKCVKIQENELKEIQKKNELYNQANNIRNNEIKRLAKLKVQKEEHIRELSPQEFEDVVSDMFRKLGYIVEQTPYVNDHGKDAIMFKDGNKYLLECKRYGADKSIGRPQFQKFFAAMIEEKAEIGFFVNTGVFTKTAYEYGNQNNIELIDIDKLLSMMKQAYPENSNEDLVTLMCRNCGEIITFSLKNNEKEKLCSKGHIVVNDISYQDTPISSLFSEKYCPRCGNQLTLINGRRGMFWGCTGYPKCSYTHSVNTM